MLCSSPLVAYGRRSVVVSSPAAASAAPAPCGLQGSRVPQISSLLLPLMPKPTASRDSSSPIDDSIVDQVRQMAPCPLAWHRE